MGTISLAACYLLDQGVVLDYAIPEKIDVTIGSCVHVPYRKRTKKALITSLLNDTDVPISKIKYIDCVVDDARDYTQKSYLKFLQRAIDYYQCDPSEVVSIARPSCIYDSGDTPEWLYLAHPSPKKAASAAAKRLCAWLAARPCGADYLSIRDAGFSARTIKVLHRDGYLVDGEAPVGAQTDSTITLSDTQEKIVAAILGSQSGYSWHMLDAITGSGKSWIYLSICQYWLQRSQQVLWLVPEIGLISPLIPWLREHLGGGHVYVWHSALTDQRRQYLWNWLRRGKPGVVVGTRSSIWLPLEKLAAVIMDEEHDTSYKQQSGLRYSTRGLAFMRAQSEGVPLVLGSATPSFAMLHARSRASGQWHILRTRYARAALPHISILDTRGHTLQAGVDGRILLAIKHELQHDRQVLLFVNRRGFAPRWWCSSCGYTELCPGCERPYTYHQQEGLLRCHRCDTQKVSSIECSKCRQSSCAPLGFGTEKITRFVAEQFPTTDVVRMDSDSCSTPTRLIQALELLAKPQARLIVATQMLVKSHNIPRLNMVVALDVDAAFHSRDFRAAEQTLAQLHQVAGRAGREGDEATVYVQTAYPEQPLWGSLKNHDYHAMADHLLKSRVRYNLPPYVSQVVWCAQDKCVSRCTDVSAKVYQAFNRVAAADISVAKPVASYYAKRSGWFRMSIVIESRHASAINRALVEYRRVLRSMKLPASLCYVWDRDPIEI